MAVHIEVPRRYTGDTNMIRFHRSIRSASNNAGATIQWSKEVTDYLNGKYAGTNVQVFAHRFGDVSTIVWEADFDTLASLDDYQHTLNANEAYWAVVAKSAGLFVEGSVDDTVLESL
jgi:hypothetical protein